MSSIVRRNNTKLIIIIVVIILIIATATYFIMFKDDYFGNDKPVKQDNPKVETQSEIIDNSGEQNEVDDLFAPVTKNYSILSDYDGYWGDVLSGNIDSGGTDLWVYVNSDDSIDISLSEYQNARFTIENLKITNKQGSFNNVLGQYTGTVYLKDNVIELTYTNGYQTLPINQVFKKISTRTITQEELFNEINRIIADNYKTVDPTMFSCKETDDFLSLYLAAGCYVKEREYANLEDETNFYRDVYLIDKKKSKLITLMELLDNDTTKMENVDRFIKNYLEVKKIEWDKYIGNTGSENDIKWPYNTFVGINFVNNFISKNFDVDEKNQVVKIKCVTNVGDKKIASNSIWAPVPFELVFDSSRLSSMGVPSRSLKEQLSNDAARAYLELIIKEEEGEEFDLFGDEDTRRFMFLNVSGDNIARLSIMTKDGIYTAYKYNEEKKEIEEVEKIDYSKNEDMFKRIYEGSRDENLIKSIICMSSDLEQINSVIDAISDNTTDENVAKMIDELKDKLSEGTLSEEEKQMIASMFETMKNGE